MKRFMALGAFALLLGGCAIPFPVQVASWAIDGISYVMTQKSVADHGISLVAQKDCAILRGVLDPGEFCRDLDDAATAVADSGDGTGPKTAALAALGEDARKETLEETEGASELLAELLEVEKLAAFDTAAGPADGVPAAAIIFDYPLYPGAETAALGVELIYIPLVFEDGVAMVDPDAAAVETAALTPEASVPPLVFEDGVPLSLPLDVPLAGAAEAAVETDAEASEQALYLGPTEDVADGADGADDADFAPAARPVPPAPGPWLEATAGRGDDNGEPAVGEPAVGEPAAGFYFVIGSFHQHLNAKKLRSRYRALTPSVLAARIEKGVVYRVVVGPFDQRHAKDIHKRIYAAGISDSWAIRVKPGEWSMAMVDPPAEAPPMEVAEEKGGWTDTALDYLQSLAQLIY